MLPTVRRAFAALPRLFERRQRRAGPQKHAARPLTLERLEDRTAPAGLAVPAFSSLPGAPASLWLDFTGLPTQNWGAYQNVTTPVFNLEGAENSTSFSPQELAAITEVWERVAEMYSPFDINVTTVQPADLGHGKTQIVAIGGSYNDWLHAPAGGISYVGGFTNPNEPNISHVFVDGTAGVAKYIAIAAAHEAGHAFGLEHQSIFSPSSALLQEYNPGDANAAPIMGLAYNAARALWWVGPADVNGTAATQNDEAVIAGAANGFGYRPDAFGQYPMAPTPLGLLNGAPGAAGVLDTPNSADFFSFTTTGGVTTFTVNPAAVGGMLHAKLGLWFQGQLIAVGASATAMGASLTANLPAGTYVIEVASYGGAGDVGQYALTAQLPHSWAPYLTAVFHDILGRAPSPFELSMWSSVLNGGWTPAQLVWAFLNSAEYHADVVQADFARYLGRSANPGEQTYLAWLLGNGWSEQNLAAAVLASGEFYAAHGNSFAAWITAVYQNLDGRPATAFEVNWWAWAHAAGYFSLYQAASIIAGSPEADAHLVAADYTRLLQRPADPVGLNGFLALMQQGYDWDIVVYGICANQEYIQRHLI
jgi:hypothetical protein